MTVVGEVFNFCREANVYLAAVAWFLMSIRFGMMLADRTRWQDRRGQHIMAWFGWAVGALLAASLGSSYYANSTTPAIYISGLWTVLDVTAIVLAIWWPHPRRFILTTSEVPR